MNDYLSLKTKIEAFPLVLGRFPEPGEKSELARQANNYFRLSEFLEQKRVSRTEEEIAHLKSVPASKREVVLAYWLYLGRYPESMSMVSDRLAARQSRYTLVEELRTSDEHRACQEWYEQTRSLDIRNAPRFVHLHIQKCAGTSFARHCLFSFTDKAHFCRENARFEIKEIEGKTIIGGHMGINVFDGLDYEPIYIAILRHPVERAISLYNYYRKRTERVGGINRTIPEGFRPENPRGTMLELPGCSDYVDNLQCRYLSGSPHFEDVLYSMSRNKFVVTTVESMPRFGEYLARNYGFSSSAIMNLNRNAEHCQEKFESEYPEVLQDIVSLNASDMALYEYVRERSIFDSARYPWKRMFRKFTKHRKKSLAVN